MPVLTGTIILGILAIGGWLFLKRDPDKYIHEKGSPMNFFFKFGRIYHHFFKIGIVAIFMIMIFAFYWYLLGASHIFAITAAIIAGAILAGGKELLDKYITMDDVVASIAGIILGFFVIIFLF